MKSMVKPPVRSWIFYKFLIIHFSKHETFTTPSRKGLYIELQVILYKLILNPTALINILSIPTIEMRDHTRPSSPMSDWEDIEPHVSHDSHPILLLFQKCRDFHPGLSQYKTGMLRISMNDTFEGVKTKIRTQHQEDCFGVREVCPGKLFQSFAVAWSGNLMIGNVSLECVVKNDKEWKRCLELMENRGWKDHIVVNFSS
jgi:hypothetical protein